MAVTTEKTDIKAWRNQAARLLAVHGLMTHRADVLVPYGVERLRDMTAAQLEHLVQALRDRPLDKKADAPPALRRARSTVLTLCNDLGIKPENGNWERLNDFLCQPRIAGKLLYEMDEQELAACAKRLRVVIKKHLADLREEARLAQNN